MTRCVIAGSKGMCIFIPDRYCHALSRRAVPRTHPTVVPALPGHRQHALRLPLPVCPASTPHPQALHGLSAPNMRIIAASPGRPMSFPVATAFPCGPLCLTKALGNATPSVTPPVASSFLWSPHHVPPVQHVPHIMLVYALLPQAFLICVSQ